MKEIIEKIFEFATWLLYGIFLIIGIAVLNDCEREHQKDIVKEAIKEMKTSN